MHRCLTTSLWASASACSTSLLPFSVTTSSTLQTLSLSRLALATLHGELRQASKPAAHPLTPEQDLSRRSSRTFTAPTASAGIPSPWRSVARPSPRVCSRANTQLATFPPDRMSRLSSPQLHASVILSPSARCLHQPTTLFGEAVPTLFHHPCTFRIEPVVQSTIRRVVGV